MSWRPEHFRQFVEEAVAESGEWLQAVPCCASNMPGSGNEQQALNLLTCSGELGTEHHFL